MPASVHFEVPTTQRAIKIKGPGQASVEKECPVPTCQPEDILVRVVCVALNPVDWKSADLSPSPDATWGTDFSGKVVIVGEACQSRFVVGDSVCGAAFGNNPEDATQGAFAEYVAIPGELVYKIPPEMSFEQAATVGTGLATAGLTLYQTLGLSWPDQPAQDGQYILVYGGGTASGCFMIQLLRLSGYIPVTTCSAKSFDRVKQLGAAEAFDYHSVSCGSEIREYTENSIKYAVDCITNIDSMKCCYTAIGSSGGQYVALDPFPIRGHTRRNVKARWIIGYTIYGRPINWKHPFKRDAQPQDREFARKWYPVAQRLLDNGKLQLHPLQVETGGLPGVIEGANRSRKHQVTGVKLVYCV
ncbi:hypothetical protein BDV24DRAFT_166856 [Aspergillus arachidicola]|uniref:Enoyl reductase (ER) domain-containing protein n=1 Tax=Aspergillus arachidicola TaxID=656916 RepID=A0A5N6Y0B1_9EURO|nr:hypothetical protein BDV24DRAFT_166856 [Aspergillus arachidicola]